ncbi:frataxin homolog, mitochondrial-like [Drosophila montana]|uniref:frataxin homolog, mitochondrial-like n=1 Tax=Drosophila montana TaxID=40370 RepID=UPI00313F01E4
MNRIRLYLRVEEALSNSNCQRGVAGPYHLSDPADSLASSSRNNNNNNNMDICVFCGNPIDADYIVDDATYDRACAETLDTLSDYFDDLIDSAVNLPDYDVVYGDGVLSVDLGPVNGMYVINRQKPSKQIWLSSPISGQKRYDYILPPGHGTGHWIDQETGETLHEILQVEMGQKFRGQSVNFLMLPYTSHN